MQFLKKTPILRILIPYFLGIVPGLFLDLNLSEFSNQYLIYFLGFAVFISAVFQLNTNNKSYHLTFGLVTFLFFFYLGLFRWNYTRMEYKISFFNPSKAEFVGVKIIQKPLTFGSKSAKIFGEIVSVKTKDGNYEEAVGGCLMYFNTSKGVLNFKVGDIFLLPNKLNQIPPKINPWGFDYPKFLKRQNIYFQGFYSFHDVIEINDKHHSLFDFIKNIRENILKAYQGQFTNPNSFAVFAALVLGNKENLDEDISNNYVNAGTMHVLAVSGLHVGILYFLLGFIFKNLKKNKGLKFLSTLLQIGIIWFYAAITGLSPSIMRAATMFSFLIIGDQLNRTSNIYNTLAISAFVLTFFQPELFASIGFQLSYLAVIGILLIYPPLYRIYTFKYQVSNYIWGLVCVSIAAQFAVLPLSIYYFNQMPTYFLLANIFVIPIATVNLVLGFLASTFFWLVSITKLFGVILNTGFWIQNLVVSTISELPFSYFSDLTINNHQVFLVYGLIASIILLLLQENKSWLRGVFVFVGLIILGNVYSIWKNNSGSKTTVFHHKKTIYINHWVDESHFTFCYGNRDPFFEKFELEPFWSETSSNKGIIITNDTLNAKFFRSGNKLYFPNLKLNIEGDSLEDENDLYISNNKRQIESLNFGQKSQEKVLIVGDFNSTKFPEIISTKQSGPIIITSN